MNYIKSVTVQVSSVFGLCVGVLIGQWHEFLTVLLIVNLIDYATGIIRGLYQQNLSSQKMYRGLLKKLAMWCGVVLAHQIDVILFQGSNSTMFAIIFGFIANEGLSTLENLVEADVIVNENIAKYLKQIKLKSETHE